MQTFTDDVIEYLLAKNIAPVQAMSAVLAMYGDHTPVEVRLQHVKSALMKTSSPLSIPRRLRGWCELANHPIKDLIEEYFELQRLVARFRLGPKGLERAERAFFSNGVTPLRACALGRDVERKEFSRRLGPSFDDPNVNFDTLDLVTGQDLQWLILDMEFATQCLSSRIRPDVQSGLLNVADYVLSGGDIALSSAFEAAGLPRNRCRTKALRQMVRHCIHCI